MIGGDKSLGQSVEPGPTTIDRDGVIQQGQPSGPPHEGSRETYDGIITSVPRDYCATPQGSSVVIIGYKIWARQREATNLANTVLQTSLRSHVKGSIIKHCYGDEKGTYGGVCSGTHNGECTPKTWSETVLFESRNAVRDSDEWWMNNDNTWGVLDYKKDAPQPSNQSTVDGVNLKLWLAQAVEAEPAPPIEVPPVEPPSLPTYSPPEYEPPSSPSNDNWSNPQPAPEKPIEPFVGPKTMLGPDDSPVLSPKLAFKRNTVTQKGRPNSCDCLIGQYSEILSQCKDICKGKTHHIVPDMVYRLGKRPEGAAMSSTNNRIKGGLGEDYPTLNQGMSVCLTAEDHSSGPDGIHSTLRGAFALLSQQSGVPGTAPLGKIYAASKRSIRSLDGLSQQCKKDVAKALDGQTQFYPTSQPGRVQEYLPLSPGADKVLRAGSY